MTELIATEGAMAGLARLERATTEEARLGVEADLLSGPSTDKPLQEGEREVPDEEAVRLLDEDDDEVEADEEVPDGS